MKKVITSIFLVLTINLMAQDGIYVHTATISNTKANITEINHPDLNNNPNACLNFVHTWNPNGSNGVYNNHPDGLYYDSGGGRWWIYNEDLSDIVLGASYNLYIADTGECFDHIATAGNTGNHITYIDEPIFNGNNPGPYAFISNYWNPNGVFNPHQYGTYYETGNDRRAIYEEGFTNVPIGAAFKVLVPGDGTERYTHYSEPGNIVNNWTVLDHPSLNDDPEATFLFEHYWGINGPATQVYLDKNLGVWYNGSRWAIYTEDTTPMPENVAFDIVIVPQKVLGNNDQTLSARIVVYPNPVETQLNVKVSNTSLLKIEIVNIMGQLIRTIDTNSSLEVIDLSNQSSGIYFLKVYTPEGNQTMKFIKS